MNMTIIIPIMGQIHDIKGILYQIKSVTSSETDFLFIDNSFDDSAKIFIEKYLKPEKYQYIKNQENIGCYKTLQQGYEICKSDILAFIHSDLMIYEIGCDLKVKNLFGVIPNIGLASFFGAQDAYFGGGRSRCWTSMIEAEIHGTRLTTDYKQIAIVDGLAMICSRRMLESTNGIDQNYLYHHFEDKEISMASLNAGFKNIVVNVPCHHWNGITVNRAEYQNWINQKLNMTDADKYCHDENNRRWSNKWKHVLPWRVN